MSPSQNITKKNKIAARQTAIGSHHSSNKIPKKCSKHKNAAKETVTLFLASNILYGNRIKNNAQISPVIITMDRVKLNTDMCCMKAGIGKTSSPQVFEK